MALASEIDPASAPAAIQTNSKNYVNAKEAVTMTQSMGSQALPVDVRTQAMSEYAGVTKMYPWHAPHAPHILTKLKVKSHAQAVPQELIAGQTSQTYRAT